MFFVQKMCLMNEKVVDRDICAVACFGTWYVDVRKSWVVFFSVESALLHYRLPPNRSSALPWALSLSFRMTHWYMPRSWRFTAPTRSTNGVNCLILSSPLCPVNSGSPFLSHWTDPIGDPVTVQLNVALFPELIIWKTDSVTIPSIHFIIYIVPRSDSLERSEGGYQCPRRRI